MPWYGGFGCVVAVENRDQFEISVSYRGSLLDLGDLLAISALKEARMVLPYAGRRWFRGAVWNKSMDKHMIKAELAEKR